VGFFFSHCNDQGTLTLQTDGRTDGRLARA